MLPTIGKQYASFPEGEATNSTYANFPFRVSSMEKLEESIEKNHVISFLSGQGLPRTKQELSYIHRQSTLNGTIYNHRVDILLHNHNCFLNTDEVQLLAAVLFCNSKNKPSRARFKPTNMSENNGCI